MIAGEEDLTCCWSTLETLQWSLAVLSTGALMLVRMGTRPVVIWLPLGLLEVVGGVDGRGIGSVGVGVTTEKLKKIIKTSKNSYFYTSVFDIR